MKIISLLLLLHFTIFSYNYEKAYISKSFDNNFSSYTQGMQGTNIAINNSKDLFVNPSLADLNNNYNFSYSSNKFFSGLYSNDNISFVFQKDSLTNMGLSLSWLNFGTLQNTTLLPKDATYDIDGNESTDSIGYWDPEYVSDFTSNDFILQYLYTKKLSDFSVGGKLNLLYKSSSINNNYGTSIDLASSYETESIFTTLIIKNFGGSLIGNYSTKEIDYQYMYLQLGVSYKKLIRERLDSYLILSLSHNALFLDNSDIVLGASLTIKSFFEIYGSYSLQSSFNDEYFDYSKIGFGVALNFKLVSIQYSQLYDNYNTISSNLSIQSGF